MRAWLSPCLSSRRECMSTHTLQPLIWPTRVWTSSSVARGTPQLSVALLTESRASRTPGRVRAGLLIRGCMIRLRGWCVGAAPPGGAPLRRASPSRCDDLNTCSSSSARRRAVARPGSALPHLLDVGQPPRLVEPRLQRAVEAKKGEPALGGDGLHPVCGAVGALGAEVHVDASVGVDVGPPLARHARRCSSCARPARTACPSPARSR